MPYLHFIFLLIYLWNILGSSPPLSIMSVSCLCFFMVSHPHIFISHRFVIPSVFRRFSVFPCRIPLLFCFFIRSVNLVISSFFPNFVHRQYFSIPISYIFKKVIFFLISIQCLHFTPSHFVQQSSEFSKICPSWFLLLSLYVSLKSLSLMPITSASMCTWSHLPRGSLNLYLFSCPHPW